MHCKRTCSKVTPAAYVGQPGSAVARRRECVGEERARDQARQDGGVPAHIVTCDVAFAARVAQASGEGGVIEQADDCGSQLVRAVDRRQKAGAFVLHQFGDRGYWRGDDRFAERERLHQHDRPLVAIGGNPAGRVR